MSTAPRLAALAIGAFLAVTALQALLAWTAMDADQRAAAEAHRADSLRVAIKAEGARGDTLALRTDSLWQVRDSLVDQTERLRLVNARLRHIRDSLRASRDTLYRELRVYIMASSRYAERAMWAEGRLNQCAAY